MRVHSRIAVLLLMAASALSGCHGAKHSEAFIVPETFDTGKKYEITFWAKNDTNRTQVDIYSKAVDDFEALYPEIDVNIRFYTDYTAIYNDVITNISTGTTPNVCITYPDHIATYMTGENVMVPLDALIDDIRYGLGGSGIRFDSPQKSEMVGKYLDECALGGSTYALPFMRSSEACYINRDFVEKLGYEVPDVLTWDFVWEVSEAATAKDENGNYLLNGQKILIPFIYKSTDNMMIQLLEQLGSGYSTPLGEIKLFGGGTRRLLEEIYLHASSGAFSTFKISGYPANFLNAGQCIFAVDSTAGATWMGSDAPLIDISPDKIIRFETAVRPVPQYDVDDIRMISQGPSVCIFNKDDPQEVLASWLFAQYLLTDSVQIAYSGTEGYVPVTLKARESPEYGGYINGDGTDKKEHYRVKLEASRLVIDHTGDTFVAPVFNGSASLRDAAGQLIESVTKSARRKEKADDEYFESLFEKTRSMYRLDQAGAAGGGPVRDLGPLPKASVILMVSLIIAWMCILSYLIYSRIKEKR